VIARFGLSEALPEGGPGGGRRSARGDLQGWEGAPSGAARCGQPSGPVGGRPHLPGREGEPSGAARRRRPDGPGGGRHSEICRPDVPDGDARTLVPVKGLMYSGRLVTEPMADAGDHGAACGRGCPGCTPPEDRRSRPESLVRLLARPCRVSGMGGRVSGTGSLLRPGRSRRRRHAGRVVSTARTVGRARLRSGAGVRRAGSDVGTSDRSVGSGPPQGGRPGASREVDWAGAAVMIAGWSRARPALAGAGVWLRLGRV
jgi:hypothetical protein